MAIATGCLALLPGVQGPAAAAGDDATLRSLKRLQHQMLLSGASARLARIRAEGRVRARQRGPRDEREAAEWRAMPGLSPRVAGRAAGDVPLNVVANDRLQDSDPFAAQAEVTLVALGARQLAAWNDGEAARVGGSAIGWAWSDDDGATWHDGGTPPATGGVGVWTSDPVLAVDEKRGRFYLAGMTITDASRNGIAVVEGAFGPAGFEWGTPMLARAVRDTLPDKPWLAADSLSGALHLSYTTFFIADSELVDQIEYQRLPLAGAWSPPEVLSLPDERSMVQGSRPAVGPDGEVHVVWTAIDTTAASGGLDRIHARRSTDRGASFGPRTVAARLWSNFGSGAPGFNRGYGFTFPAVAVDRSRGGSRGRVYVAWNGTVNFYDDTLGAGAERPEVESNDAAATATPFEVGEAIHGALSTNDVDHWRFSGEQGRTAIFFVDSVSADLDLSVRVVCSDGVTRLAWSSPLGMRRRLVLFTLPATGAYLLRLMPNSPASGNYRLRSGWDGGAGGPGARDQRDVFVAWSDDGAAWSDPVRVNDDPGHFDDWLPEIAVGADGTVWASWYDWRDGAVEACGGISAVYLARSEDGGGSWLEPAPVSDELSAWSAVSSNVAPNQGDYIALAANHEGVVAGWADGRWGNPDAVVTRLARPARVALAAASASDSGVALEWEAPSAGGVTAVLERRVDAQAWQPLASVTSDAGGRIAWFDAAVEPGRSYGYRLVIEERGGPRVAGETTVAMPAGPQALALERAWPNPAGRDLYVQLALPDARPARLELLDVGGRRVRSLEVGGRAGRRVLNLGAGASAKPGIYWVRLSAGGESHARRVAFVR